MIKTLVLNKLNDPSFLARSHGGYGAGGGYGLDGKRGRSWCEYGYKQKLTHDDYYAMWSRLGVANGAVRVLLDTCWQTNPTSNNARFEQLAKESGLWQAVRKADKYRLASVGWSALLLTIAGESYADATTKGNKTKALESITPIWSNSIAPHHDSNGQPLNYQIQLANGTALVVHPSRVVIIGSTDDEPFLRAGFNSGVDIEKILGGSGESYLKNAARQLAINFDSEGEMDDLVKISGKSEDTVRAAMNEVIRELNRGNDAAVVTQGATVQMLTTGVSDPTGNFNVAAASFGASVGLPVRSFIGNNTGERASTEDNKALKARGQSRRVNELSSDIAKLMRALYNAGVTGQLVACEWDDLTVEPLSDRIVGYAQLVQAMATSNMLSEAQQKEVARITGLALNG